MSLHGRKKNQYNILLFFVIILSAINDGNGIGHYMAESIRGKELHCMLQSFVRKDGMYHSHTRL